MGCALILYHGSIKERGFSRRAERQKNMVYFFTERIRRSAGKSLGLRQIKGIFNKDNPNLLKIQGGYLRCLLTRALLAEDETPSCLKRRGGAD